MAEESELVVAGDVVAEVMEREVPSTGEAVGSVVYLGRWKEIQPPKFPLVQRDKRAMPVKMKHMHYDTPSVDEAAARIAFGRLVDELVQQKAPSGVLAFSTWTEQDDDGPSHKYWGFSWSASPDDVSYQRHGFVRMESTQHENIRFADFEGVIDDVGEQGAWGCAHSMAVYRMTLPRGGLDADKWAGRPPPPAPADLYTGPRSDGLLSTDEISGDYSAPDCSISCQICNSMTVVPLGADAIETWSTGFCCLPPLGCGPHAWGEVQTRDKGTNKFGGETFWADGRVTKTLRDHTEEIKYRKRPHSQKRTFRKVETKELAGKWRGCFCIPEMLWPLSYFYWTTKKALDEDRYAESGCGCGPLTPLCLPLIPIVSNVRAREYANGLPTNRFCADPVYDSRWHRDDGCAAGLYASEKKIG